MEEDVRQYAECAVARRVVMLVAEDRSVDLSLGRVFQPFDLLFGFRGQVGLERLDVFFHPRLNPLQQAYTISVFAVSVFFRHCFLWTCSQKTRGRKMPRATLRPQVCSVF